MLAQLAAAWLPTKLDGAAAGPFAGAWSLAAPTTLVVFRGALGCMFEAAGRGGGGGGQGAYHAVPWFQATKLEGGLRPGTAAWSSAAPTDWVVFQGALGCMCQVGEAARARGGGGMQCSGQAFKQAGWCAAACSMSL